MAASEHPLAAGKDPFVVRNGVLDLAFGQAGGGQAVSGGQGLHIKGALYLLAAGQGARQQLDGGGLTHGGVCGGQLLDDAEGIWMTAAERSLAVPGCLLQDGYGVCGLACHDEGVGQADADCDESGMPGRELAAPLGQYPLVPGNGLRRLACG